MKSAKTNKRTNEINKPHSKEILMFERLLFQLRHIFLAAIITLVIASFTRMNVNVRGEG